MDGREAVSVLKLANLFCYGFAGVAPVHAPPRAVFRSVGLEPEEQKGHLQNAKQPRRTEQSRHRPLLRGQSQRLLGGAAEYRSEGPGCWDPRRRASRLPAGKGQAQNGRREDKMLERCEVQLLRARQCLTCHCQPGTQRTTGHRRGQTAPQAVGATDRAMMETVPYFLLQRRLCPDPLFPMP